MTKLVQNDIASLTNEQSALAALNANYALNEVFSDSVLSRDGFGPNQMLADLDMNSNQIINLPAPTSLTEPLRLQELVSLAGGTVNITSPFVDVRDHGAVGDGAVDDTTALQAAINQCVSTGDILYISPGTYKITNQLNINDGITIIGAGWGRSAIQLGSNTINGLVVTSERGVQISGFQITGNNNGTISTATSGSLISITGPSGGNPNQIYLLRDLRLVFGFTNVSFGAAQVWTIDNCYALGTPTTGTGVVITNTEFPGNGELCISNSLIQGGDAVTTWGGSGIFHASGVNLKIVNSEIFGWVNGYNLTLGSATAMAGLYIANSVFSQVENAITLNKGTGTAFGLVTITGNQIYARNPFASDSNTGWLTDVTITSNVIGVGHGQPVSAATGTGISIPAIDTFTVIGNVIQGAVSNNSIVIGVNAVNGFVAGNQLRGSLGAASNSSTTTTLLAGSAGVMTVSNPFASTSTLRTGQVAVASLPAAGTKGRRHFVTDANAVTFQSIVAGGGANNVPVFDDGTNWRIG